MANCKLCGKGIVKIKAPGGKSIPCDPEPTTYWAIPGGHRRIVTPNGEVIACKLNGYPQNATGIGYVLHWDTCPEWRKLQKGAKQ